MPQVFLSTLGHMGTKGYRLVIAKDHNDAESKMEKTFPNEDFEVLETIQ